MDRAGRVVNLGKLWKRELPAPALLSIYWSHYRNGPRPYCPHCREPRAVKLGLRISVAPHAYQFHCVECGWRSAWFSQKGDDRIVLEDLDPNHGAV